MTQRAIEPIDTAGATPINIEFTLAQRPDGTFEYGINGSPFAKGKPISARPGETQVWTIVNKTKWSHPFHLHGFFFQVLDEQGRHVEPLEWKDTVNVPLEQTVKVVVRYDDRAGQLDVSLPHPRPCRRRSDGHGRPRRPTRRARRTQPLIVT